MPRTRGACSAPRGVTSGDISGVTPCDAGENRPPLGSGGTWA
jgi:hypothetical protein